MWASPTAKSIARPGHARPWDGRGNDGEFDGGFARVPRNVRVVNHANLG